VLDGGGVLDSFAMTGKGSSGTILPIVDPLHISRMTVTSDLKLCAPRASVLIKTMQISKSRSWMIGKGSCEVFSNFVTPYISHERLKLLLLYKSYTWYKIDRRTDRQTENKHKTTHYR